ncbi:endonuclease/exonuclease/phosphatase family protein [Sporichthya polymorpha]|uniref:endonuclease/exonuclease/phosphatase family protein n=1 Tax=Sporichthya polymorpha TaxID=35751 RepID=UPI0003658E81|nr:endonuclease/exonuclease/phosphatase family protein [Sporichthya polymorpha]
MRVVSYNVRSLRDDADAVAAILRGLAPDLVCVQEAPRFLFSARTCRALAAAAGLSVLAGGRSAAGNLLLGGPRVRLVSASRVRLPRSGRRHRRALALAVVEVGRNADPADGGARLLLGGTHLSLDPLEREQQTRRVLAHLETADAPHRVLGADVNDVPGSRVWTLLTGPLRDAWALAPTGGELTFPARGPNRRIDALLVSPGVAVRAAGVPADLAADPAAATDHLPVLAELELPLEQGT